MPPVGPLPEGFVLTGDAERGWCALRADLADALTCGGFGLASDGAVRPTDLGGRDALVELDAPGLAERGVVALLRRHRRGGLAARLGRRRFPDPARPFDELRLAEDLRADGVRTPAVLAARARRAPGGFDLALVTERVPAARDLAAALQEASPRERHVLVRAAGRFVAELFDSGLDHRDLHPKNLLVAAGPNGEPHLWVLDLDRCARRRPLADARRAAALARCLRWCLRRRTELGFARTDALRFLVALSDGDPWRPTWRALKRRTERRMWLRTGRS